MPTKRYPGVRPFETTDQALFFGRERDVQDLSGLITLEKLVVLFGRSGHGKSSLINAGILPRLAELAEQDEVTLVPILIHFGAYLEGVSLSPVQNLLARLNEKTAADPAGDFLKNYLPDNSLWQQFKRRSVASDSFLLLFDQFEEFFTYPIVQQEAFKTQLAELLYTEMPQSVRAVAREMEPAQRLFLSRPLQVNVLFAIRDDRMSQLHDLKDRLPAVLDKCYPLKSLSIEQAKRAIEEPAKKQGDFATPGFTYSTEALNLMLDKLSESKQEQQSNGIETFQLQIICQYLEEEVAAGRIPGNHIEPAHFADKIDDIFEGYYQRLLDKLPQSATSAAQHLIEESLIFSDPKTGEARRLSVDADVLKHQNKGINNEVLSALASAFLLRRTPNSVGGYNYEVSHDTLIKPILNTAAKREKARLRSRNRAILSTLVGALFPLAMFSFINGWYSDGKAEAKEMELNVLKIKNQKLDSVATYQRNLDSAEAVVLHYFECVKKKDPICISTYCADTMEQYYITPNMPKAAREKEEWRYFKKNPNASGGIPMKEEIAVEFSGSRFLVTVNSTFENEQKGTLPVIYNIELDSAMKIVVLRSYLAKEIGKKE